MHLPKHTTPTAPLHRCTTSNKRKNLLLFFLLFTAFVANSQAPAESPHRHPHREKLEYQGFTIGIIPEDKNNYRFTITKDGKRLLKYEADEHSPQALTTPEKAVDGAKWMIEQYQKTGQMPHRLPPPELREAKRNLVSKPKKNAN